MDYKVYELFIEEDNEFSGVEAISIVEEPAIEEDFVALKAHKIEMAEVDTDKRILMGPALIPDRKIYRRNDEEEYYIFFSKDTVRKASELFLARGNQNNSTLEHQYDLNGLSVVESWIVDDPQKDKSKLYNLNVPEGTWMVSVKVNNEEVWQEFVKSGKVKGFSIEGYFSDNTNRPKESVEEDLCSDCFNELQAEYALLEAVATLEEGEVQLESYGGYPESASNNAKLGIKRNKELNNKCATQVGKVRAQQLVRKEKFTLPTLKRIYSYLSRAEAYYDPAKPEACGTISYLLWGGKSMKNWVESKLNGLDELALDSDKIAITGDIAMISGRLAYSTVAAAELAAKDIGCEGYHTHELDGREWYMPCFEHANRTSLCWEGYKQDGWKMKDGKRVPNCVEK
jgi:hypothetical protein